MGGGYNVPLWSTGTDEEIVAALEAHYAGDINLYDYWSIGDERVIHLNAIPSYTLPRTSYSTETHIEQDITMVLIHQGDVLLADNTTECVFVVAQKTAFSDNKGKMTGKDQYTNWGYSNCLRRPWCNGVYRDAFPSTIKNIFKLHKTQYVETLYGAMQTVDDYFALLAEYEIFGSITQGYSNEILTQFDYYKTSSNRDFSNLDAIWLRSVATESGTGQCFVAYYYPSNWLSYSGGSRDFCILPFGVI